MLPIILTLGGFIIEAIWIAILTFKQERLVLSFIDRFLNEVKEITKERDNESGTM